MQKITPQNATMRDIPRLARLLAESLFDDPLQCWLFPDVIRRLELSERMFRRVLKQRIPQGLVRVIRDSQGLPVSVANWTPPHPPALTGWQRRMETLFWFRLFGRRLKEVRAGFTALAARLPPQPNWYLQALATGEPHRGGGYASCLLREKFAECDASNLLLSLQTSSEANRAYYHKLGFHLEHELMLSEGLPVWLMCRSPSRFNS